MRKTAILEVGSLLFLCVSMHSAALAQSDTYTQVGTWKCTLPRGNYANYAFPFNCPMVPFPSPFGGQPTVVITGCTSPWTNAPKPQRPRNPQNLGECLGSDNLKVIQPTATGFIPQIGNLSLPTVLNTIDDITVSGNWIAVGPLLLNATVQPRFLVVAVVYAPPGTNGGHSTSAVSYSSGTITATTTSASRTFKSTNSLSLSVTGLFGAVGASDTYTFSNSSTDAQSLVVSKAKTASFTRPGPGADGINHDEDIIYVVLNPTVSLALSPSSVSWTPVSSAQTPIPLAVAWLNGDNPNMPGDILNALQGAGITPAEYSNILARDPFTVANYTVDPNRFSYVTSFYYLPPLNPNDPVISSTTSLTDTSADTVGNEVDDTYSVALSLSVSSGKLFDFAKADLKDTNSWEWTSKTSRSTTNTSTQGAVATVGGPAYGYKGPSECDVYVDTIYHTFAFALAPAGSRDSTLEGSVVDSTGKPIPGTTVMLVENGLKHPTFTNAKGEFAFYVPFNGSVRVESEGDVQITPRTPTSKRLILHRHGP